MLKQASYFFVTLLIGVIALTGCISLISDDNHTEKPNGNEIVEEPAEAEVQPITVEERSSGGYRTIKVVDNIDELLTIVKILKNAEWEENIKVQMELPPDYRFKLNSSNYAIWLTPNGDRLEIIIDGQAKYIKLPQKESEKLFKITTGNELKKL